MFLLLKVSYKMTKLCLVTALLLCLLATTSSSVGRLRNAVAKGGAAVTGGEVGKVNSLQAASSSGNLLRAKQANADRQKALLNRKQKKQAVSIFTVSQYIHFIIYMNYVTFFIKVFICIFLLYVRKCILYYIIFDIISYIILAHVMKNCISTYYN